ncbi:MAG: ABC transporter ATP-binding protein [bacterium]|nr:ABC transporter ATP-binding protein [bacterium]
MTEEKKPKFTWQQKRIALWRQLAPYRTLLISLSVAEIIAALANGVVPYITGKFFDTLVTPYAISLPEFGSYPAWLVLLVLWAVIQLIANGISWAIDRSTRQLTTKLEAGVQANAFAHLLTLPVSFHKKQRTGEITDNVSKAGWMLGSLVNTILSLAPQFLTVVVGVAISFAIRPSLAFVLLSGVLVYIAFLFRVLPTTSRYQEEGFKIWNRAYGDAQDAYTNVQTVKQAGAEEYERKRIIGGFFEQAVPLWYRMERAWSNLNFSQRIIVTLTQGAIFLYSVYLIGEGAITIGDLIAFNAYAGMIMGPFVSLGHQWQTVQNGLVALARAELIFGTASETYEPVGSVRLPDLKGAVVFRDVHFAYEAGQAEVLKGVSFTVDPGEIVAFVGETGVGKSTAAELISGYYFASEGRITIDGVDIKQVNLKDLRSQMAVVPQEVVLFNSSIGDNIRYGRPEATDAEVEAAARRAHADGFIEKFPEKYKQEVGERGIKLSVGQKQRVAIARAMLRNPRILILDEPTSALDAETEQYITKSLEELMRGRTTFIIAHRLSTVRKANKIIVLKEGVVAEQGKHDELMKIENGIYRHLYELHIGLHE